MIEISQYTTRSGTGYQVSLTLSNMNGGSYTVIVGGVTGQPRTANGTLVETITAVDGSGLRIVASAGVTGFIDQVSMNAISIPSTTGITAGKAGTNNPVSTWRARRGSLVLNQPTASRRPILQGGGVEFDGVDDFYSGAAIQAMHPDLPWSCVSVVDLSDTEGGLNCIFQNKIPGLSSHGFACRVSSSVIIVGLQLAGAGNNENEVGLQIGYTPGVCVICIRWDNVDRKFDLRVNGSVAINIGAARFGGAAGFSLGARTTNTDNFGGTLKTFAIYNRVLSDAEILKIENYYNA